MPAQVSFTYLWPLTKVVCGLAIAILHPPVWKGRLSEGRSRQLQIRQGNADCLRQL